MTREAPHLLLVHGGSHGAWCWDAAAEELAAREVYARLTPQPFGPYLQAAPVGIEDAAVPRRYLRCTQDLTFPGATATGFAARAAAAPEDLMADHCAMITAPALVAAALARPFTR